MPKVFLPIVMVNLLSGEITSAQGVHGVSIAKGCEPNPCIGEFARCDVEIGYSCAFGDTLQVLEAWDIVDIDGDTVRVQVDGSLPIVASGGNTTCTVAGALPCLIGPGGSTLSGLPGDTSPGFVRFRQDTYVVQADDPLVLLDQATVRWHDLCDNPDTSGCSSVQHDAVAPASARIQDCDDGDPCTVDECDGTACQYHNICGGCCFPVGVCIDSTDRADCKQVGGFYLGDGRGCDDDQDGDGVFGCDDLCPNDPQKSDPGICGCSSPDIDSDQDGVLDCLDRCPDTPPEFSADEFGCPPIGACCFPAGVCFHSVLDTDCEIIGGV